MERELVNLLKVLVVDKFGYFLVLIAATSSIWVLSVWALNAASAWSERYRLLFQGFIPWVKAMLVVSALWVMVAKIPISPITTKRRGYGRHPSDELQLT